MVPADCAICKKRLMIWDVNTFYCRRPMGIGEVQICRVCVPNELLLEEDGVQLDFITKEQQEIRIAATRDRINNLKEQKHDRGFTKPENGSQDRFDLRKKEVPWFKHTLWWFIHNCVAHPLIGILPLTSFFKFHDWTSVKMHGKS